MPNIWKYSNPALPTTLLAALVVSVSLLPPAMAQFVQQGDKLVGTGSAGDALQGTAVALSADGNTAIVGGSWDNSGTGAVWVFTRSGGVWSQQGDKLVGTGATGSANQGWSVALSADGNTAIVGGPGDSGIGAAWVFTRSAGVWSQQGGKLVGTGGVGYQTQGTAVALSADGNTAIVGGSADFGSSPGEGGAWVFTRSGGAWSQQGGKLVGTGGVGVYSAAAQGTAVALSADGNTAIVGGPFDDLDGNIGYAVGAAWVFTRSGGAWSQQGDKLVGKDFDSYFRPSQGWSVALSADGNTAIVGGPFDANNEGVRSGAAWRFTRSDGVWTQQGRKLVGTGGSDNAEQGISVALSADANTALVGGPSSSNFNPGVGAVWVYVTPTGSNPFIAPGGVVNSASFLPAISQGTWISVLGANLASTIRTWASSDFSNGNLPTQLDGVSVTVNGKAAYVYYISPSQLNVLTPADTIQGPVSVQVTNDQGKSNIVNATEGGLSPALFTFSQQGGKYVAAVRSDGAYIGPPTLVPGLTTIPAKPGDIILLYGTGFGLTTPPSPIGQVVNPSPLAAQATVTIGGVSVKPLFAGIVSPGLYQFNVMVPVVSDGDKAVSVGIGGSFSQPNTYLTIKQ